MTRWAAAAILLLGVCSSGSSPVLAQSDPGRNGSSENPIVVYANDSGMFRRGGPAEELIETARLHGRIRVNVGLRMRMQADDLLSPAAAEAQRRALREI